jgi:hypothetical protein
MCPAFGFAVVWPKKRTRPSLILAMHCQSGLSSNTFPANELQIFSAYFLWQDTGIGRLQCLTGKYTVFIKTLLMAAWWSNYITFASLYYLCEAFFSELMYMKHINKTTTAHMLGYSSTSDSFKATPTILFFFIYSFIHSFNYLFIIRPVNWYTINTDHVTSSQIQWHYKKIHSSVQNINQSYKL